MYDSKEIGILIVDDEASVRLLLQEILEGAGYRCREAECVEQAIARLAGDDFHLVLLDMRMPGMDGLDLLRHIRSMDHEIGVVMVSAVDDIATAVQTLREGAFDYVLKPFRPDEILERARGAVERVVLARENRRYALHLRDEVERRTEDLRAIQDDLRRSEERRRLLMEQAGEPFLILDGEAGEVLEANRRAETLFGYRCREMDGLPIEAIDRAGQLVSGLEAMGENGGDGRIAVHLHRKDGAQLEVAVSAARVEGPDGPLLSLILRDAEEATPSWPRFLGRLSHELRTPLTSILGHSDIVEMLGMEIDQQQRQSLRSIRANARQCIRLVENLLDHSRRETRERDPRPAEIQVEDVVHEVVDTLRPLAGEKGIGLRSRLPGSLPELWGDGQALRQVLLNLGANAIQYTHRGGVGLGTRYRDGVLRIQVADTGVGIAREDQERIFQEGERLAGGEIPGAGLGLAIARRLARRMGGDIHLWSRFGWGSVFTLELPLPAAERSVPETPRWVESA